MILILAENYPSENHKYALAYIHTRNLYYKQMGIEINVLNFRAEASYQYEGINVISIGDFQKMNSNVKIDLLVSHAPNLRNHVKFIVKNYKRIKYFIMVFHGHEVLKISKYYPKPFNFVKQNTMKKKARSIYDSIKLPVLRLLIKNLVKRKIITLIFVSEWMKEHFSLNLNIDQKDILNSSMVIPNSVHPVFLKHKFEFDSINKIGDFIIIRPLDNSKYGIDVVRNLAIKFPDLTFHIYGEGEFFNYFTKPDNIILIKKYFSQSELPEILNKYRAALMPTRLDAQGVMMCEMASFGIPIVTSDIPICTEMLSSFENAFFVNNETLNIDLNVVVNYKLVNSEKNLKFADENTVYKEVELIKKVIKVD